MAEGNGRLIGGREHGREWLSVTPPDDDDNGEVKRFSVDVPIKDAGFLERLADYRNAMAAAQNKRLKRQWTMKSVAESFITAGTATNRQALKELLDELGDLPEGKEAMAEYVKKAIRREGKFSK